MVDLRRPTGEFDTKSMIVLPEHPTSAMTYSVTFEPTGVPIQAREPRRSLSLTAGEEHRERDLPRLGRTPVMTGAVLQPVGAVYP